MNWLKKSIKLKKQFLELVANAEPFEFTDMLGQKVKIKPYGDPSICNFTIYFEYETVDCNNKVRIIKESKYIPSDGLSNFNSYYADLKYWMDRSLNSFFGRYKEESGYKTDCERLKKLQLEYCIHRESNGSDEYITSYILSDFKRAMLYLQALTEENQLYLEEYKQYIFTAFRWESESIAQRYEMSKKPITADEPKARYDNYNKWLIDYQKTLENMVHEKEIESKVENLDKLLEEVNKHD